MEAVIVLIIYFVMPALVIFYFVYESLYYKSEKFLDIRKKIENHVNDCNEMNSHIEELKSAYAEIKHLDYGQSEYIDKSQYNYKRPEYNKFHEASNIYECSSVVCNNARQQPFKYICKYFNIDASEEALNNFEKILNDFSAAEQGKFLLKNERDTIVNGIINEIPFLIKTINKKKFIRKLGFKDIDLSQLYFPDYTFRYISPGGNKSSYCKIIMDINNLERFVEYLSSIVKFRKSSAGQRALMSTSLREKIKNRDNYTCQKCSLSTRDEANLLLEIDHKLPISKGGMTIEDNLQTLCWRCNRKKGSKSE